MKKQRTAAVTGGAKAGKTGGDEAAWTPRIAGTYSLPALFVIALGVLAYLGQAELGYHHGQFSAAVYEPYGSAGDIPKEGGGVDRVKAGAAIYQSAGCVACHQPNGSGNPANGCPPLAKSDWVAEEGAGRLIRIVLHGARGKFTVSGQAWDSPSGMTPFGGNLSDEQIANVLTFVRQSTEWGNKAPEVTPEMVKAVRDKTASRTTQWTADELLKIQPNE